MKKTYLSLLKESWKSIKKSYKRNLKDRSYSSAGYICVYDNFHVLSESFDECKFHPQAKEKNTPYIFKYIYNFLSEKNFKVSEESFFSFLQFLGKEYYLTYKDFFSISSIISAACIYEAGRICELSLTNNEEIDLKNLNGAISLLRSKRNWDFEIMISQISKTEQCFIEFEPSYSLMDPSTKNRYRETVSAFSASEKISEKDTAEIFRSYCSENGITPGDVLFKEDKSAAILFTLLWSFFSVLTLFIAVYHMGTLAALLAIPSIFVFGLSISDLFMSVAEKPISCPRLELESIPDEGKTAVVISSLLTTEEENEKMCQNLERFYLLNRDDNICFTILADFPQGNSVLPTEREKAVMEDLFSQTEKLCKKYGDKFTAFARNRKYYDDEKVCYGEERKRGAITALINFICDGTPFDYSSGNTEKLFGVKFLFLLDSDTGIGFSAVKEMVSCALHPQNKPVIENGKVTKGYGIFQPSVKFCLVHKKQTEFESFITGSGGTNNYESASYDRFQTVFGSGIFCGKGLVNVDLYKKIIIPSMPDKVVLSHDMPEGNFLRCRLVSDITTTDGAPTNAISFFSRLHRWIRGDVQNLIFLKREKKSDIKMSDYSRFKIICNILRHAAPISSLSLIVLSAFSAHPTYYLLFAFLYILFPFISVLLCAPFRAYNRKVTVIRRYYSEVTGVYSSNILRLLYEIAVLPHNAYVSFNAFLKSIYRLIFTKKKLLEWKTFGDSERSSKAGPFCYYRKFFINVISALFLFLSQNIILGVLGVIWIMSPLALYLMSKPQKEDDPISEEERKTLFKYSEKIWAFFAENVDARTNYLPPDNIQTAPTDSIAMRTSPTNIGFYLISCIAAVDFGFITKEQCKKRIENTLTTIENLEKWNGHLYNWYELDHLSVIGEKFISTVDSGNFVTMLVSLKESLVEFGFEDTAERVKKIIDETNFFPLYNKKKKLFTIGFNENTKKQEENCYDLFMSEARTTSYFAVAKEEVPVKHWNSLGRTLISENGFLGMASWSGTMFEYFMSVLFLPLYKNSFSYEALSFAYSQQKKRSVSKLWGMSESGFYSFDSELNYQYKAHGIPSLSLKRYPKNEFVFSPYSSFLTLCIDRKGSLANLKHFMEQGVWGQYGFYESVDLTKGKSIVKSYMSHHMGMSIIGAANACFDNIFVKRFMSDEEMNAARDLLKERVPTDIAVYKNPRSQTRASLSSKLFDGITSRPSIEEPKTALISSGNLDFRVSDCGTVQLLYRGIPLNEADFQIGHINHSFAAGFVDSNAEIKYTAPLLCGDYEACSFEFGKSYSSHIVSGKDFAASVSYTLSEQNDCFIIETKGNIKRKFSPFIVFEPQMISDREYYSGKSFACMKTSVEFDEEKECLFVKNKGSKFVLCVVCNKKIDRFLTGRDSLEVGTLFKTLENGKNEPSVYPLCYLKTSPISGGCAKFYIGVGKTKAQSFASCEKEKKRFTSTEKQLSHVDPALLAKNASAVLFKRLRFTDKVFLPIREELWKKGISGDYPLFALYVKEICRRELSSQLKAYEAAYRAHLKYDLFLFYDEEDLYFRKTEQKLNLLLSKAGCLGLKDKSPGIHLLNVNDAKALFEAKDAFSEFKTISNQIYTEEEKKLSSPVKIEDKVTYSFGNYIDVENRGFVFYKGSLKERKPYSYVLSGKNFGSVVTDMSLGFTFSENSRLFKLSSYDESPNAQGGEKVYASYGGEVFDLCAISKIFKCKDGVAIYEGNFSDVQYTVCTFVSVEKKEKYVVLSFSRENVSAAFSFRPMLGEILVGNGVIQCKKSEEKKESYAVFYNPFSISLKQTTGFCSASGTQNTTQFYLPFSENITLFASGQKVIFKIGETDSKNDPKNIDINYVLGEKGLQEDFSRSFVPKIDIKTDIQELDTIFPFLFYQTAASRFYAKTGFYQNGGAFGFRDQLQDCLSIVYSKPNEVRHHILNAASHQYLQGDVMHWWHELKGEHIGVRTTCSDDFLWLPIVVSKYIKLTGDMAILKEYVPFLQSSPLEDKNERFEKAVFTQEKAPLYHHCVLALNYGYSKCHDGIPLMGSCDWNDGFSKMGALGTGKSLFSARLLVMATKAFAPFMDFYKDDFSLSEGLNKAKENNNNLIISSEELLKRANETEQTIEEKYFQNDQYVRCISDNGQVFGTGETKACKTDLLCQIFSVFGGPDKKRAKDSLLRAFDTLFEKETKTLKLFSPPFDDSTEKGGYINDYPKYVRENGGQYTHAAVWTAIALIECGEGEMGLKLLSMINPLNRCKNTEGGKIYKNEPYVLSADIYSSHFGGRGGWSWYTGAASWYSVGIIEYVLGLKFRGTATIDGKEKYIGAFKCLEVKPLIPYNVKISLGDYTLNIVAKKGIPCAKLDGKPVLFPITIPPKNSTLEVFFE